MAKRLEKPRRPHVIEPFAGSAGYAVYWQPHKATLIERDPVIAGVWRYLIKASSAEILALPIVESLDNLPRRTPQEAKDLIGFWFTRATTSPSKRRSNWARGTKYGDLFWGKHIRTRIAGQVDKIRDWKLIKGDYSAGT